MDLNRDFFPIYSFDRGERRERKEREETVVLPFFLILPEGNRELWGTSISSSEERESSKELTKHSGGVLKHLRSHNFECMLVQQLLLLESCFSCSLRQAKALSHPTNAFRISTGQRLRTEDLSNGSRAISSSIISAVSISSRLATSSSR